MSKKSNATNKRIAADILIAALRSSGGHAVLVTNDGENGDITRNQAKNIAESFKTILQAVSEKS